MYGFRQGLRQTQISEMDPKAHPCNYVFGFVNGHTKLCQKAHFGTSTQNSQSRFAIPHGRTPMVPGSHGHWRDRDSPNGSPNTRQPGVRCGLFPPWSQIKQGQSPHIQRGQHYRLSRARLPSAHSSLTLEEERLWRQLQMDSLPCRAVLDHVHPSLHPFQLRPRCGERAMVQHQVWACAEASFSPINSTDQWIEALSSSDPQFQKELVTRVAEVVTTHRVRLTA